MRENLKRRSAGSRCLTAYSSPCQRNDKVYVFKDRPVVPWALGLLSVLVFSFHYAVQAQSSRPGGPVLNAAAYSRLFNDAVAASVNPATVSDSSEISAAILARRGFMLPELGSYLITGSFRTNRAWFGAQLHYGGSADYNESMVGITYGRDLGNLRLGIQFNYHRISIAGYGSSGAPSADVAVTWLLSDRLQAGIHAINPMPGFLNSNKDEHYPSVYRVGAGYDLSQDCHLFMVAGKQTNHSADVQIGLHYRIMKRLFLRFGVHTDGVGPEASIGWELKDFRLFIAGKYHSTLGFTPGLQMNYQSLKSW